MTGKLQTVDGFENRGGKKEKIIEISLPSDLLQYTVVVLVVLEGLQL